MSSPPLGPAVVLVHGLWMRGWLDMALLRHRLSERGFHCHQYSYPSRAYDLAEQATRLQQFLQTEVPGSPVHLVGHSLGGLVCLALFHHFPQQRPGRIVTLGTPHSPSYVAQQLAESPLGRWLMGKSDSGLLMEEPYPVPPGREVGAIAGTMDLGFGWWVGGIPSVGDGTVTVAETQLAGLTDHLILPTNHMGLLTSAEAADQVAVFLEKGRFRVI